MKKIDFTIGADLEVIATQGGELINAKKFCGDEWETGELGSDGHPWLFELRPKASFNPLEVVHNIRNIFINQILNNSEIIKLDWEAGTFREGKPLGGHIHFGLPVALRKDKELRLKISDALNQILLPLSFLIEVAKERRNRCEWENKGYGSLHFDPVREKPHGFEWRVISSWIVCQKVSAAVLCLAKAIVYEVLNNPKFNYPQIVGVEDTLIPNKLKYDKRFLDIWNTVKNLELYPKYKSYIDILYILITKRLSWYPKRSFVEVWGLLDVSKILSSQHFTLESIWGNFIKI